MNLVIVTGMSGAGKSTALKFLEDMGFYCADNIPPSLMAGLTREVSAHYNTAGEEYVPRLAIGVDIRLKRLFEGFAEGRREIEKAGYPVKILFLDASEDVLIKRYKETRRSHPLAPHDRLATGIEAERELLREIRARSDYIIDTTHVLTRDLRRKMREIFFEDKSFDSLIINIISFGYKYGIPTDSDLVLDVRFLPNPFYDLNLRRQTGNDPEVAKFVMERDETRIFLEKFGSMLDFLIPRYIAEGKNQLVVAIGCTGGKHRSVAISSAIANTLQKNGNSVIISHRDIEKDRVPIIE
ncbi:MAG: RNase adapter RapZ [Defluviitaleaceae bacterium]|nr:RNase adapter RapZ [Defluviitaleaceae bacterium]